MCVVPLLNKINQTAVCNSTIEQNQSNSCV